MFPIFFTRSSTYSLDFKFATYCVSFRLQNVLPFLHLSTRSQSPTSCACASTCNLLLPFFQRFTHLTHSLHIVLELATFCCHSSDDSLILHIHYILCLSLQPLLLFFQRSNHLHIIYILCLQWALRLLFVPH